MKQKGQGRYGLGAASLILILLVLCLALLGVLSLMSARADLGLGLRHAQLASDYAQAAAQVQTALADMDVQLTDAWMASQDEADYAKACCAIEEAAQVKVDWLSDTCAQMRFDAGDAREILVEIERCAWDEASKTRYTLKKHTLVDVMEWEQTDSLMLIGM